MIDATETFDGTWPFEARFSTTNGFRMHYVDEGEGAAIVCLHGEPTWGYLYRNMIGPLAQHGRVVVPDHMGFGKSETPQDREYTLGTHTDNLLALLDELDLNEITFVAQDWGGPIATQATLRQPERVAGLVLMNTLAGFGQVPDGTPDLASSEWFQWIGGGLDSGRTEAVLRNLGSTVLSVMKIIGFERSEVVTDTWIRAYSEPFPTWEESIGGYEFPIDAITGRIAEYAIEGAQLGVDRLTSKPAILLEGLEDHAIPPARAIADFRSLWPEGAVVELPGVGHFCQEDAPEVLVASIVQFLHTTAGVKS